jgi:hypothetical protein
MKIAPVFEEQFHRKQDSQQQLHLSPPLPKQLTLDDISPVWASRLETENFPTFMSLTWFKWYNQLRFASKCIIGEAYGHTSRYMYTCDECGRLGSKFMYYFLMNWHGKLEQNKQRFIAHWNEKHQEYSLLRFP